MHTQLLDIARQRLLHQRLLPPLLERPADVVQWLGVVQAQDYAGAKWALGLRLHHAVDSSVEQAFTDGSILRTHLLRPTWHFVTPADIRWMLALTAPRVQAVNATMYRKLELDDAVFRRSTSTLITALQGGQQRTRDELRLALEQAGITTTGAFRLAYILMRAELDGLVCSGPRRGKQFTYMLLDERVPEANPLERDQALAELTRRYLASHGPATLQDFVVWSGLTMADAKRGITSIASQLEQQVIAEQCYWFVPSAPPPRTGQSVAHLLPNYDEYFIGFKDRSAILEAVKTAQVDRDNSALAAHIVLVNGQVVGGWKRTHHKRVVEIVLHPIVPLTAAEQGAVVVAAQQYAAFLELPVTVDSVASL